MAFAPVAQKKLAEVGLEATPKRRLSTTPAFQFSKHEFNMLAGAQQVGRKVRAGTVVIAEAGTTNRDAIAIAAGRVVYREL